MSKIVIGVACHKASELPKNDVFLPIHVGAANAKKELAGLQRDDEGDNISEKNPMYCELTAQYWLWKNVDADYYGLCHYRRYPSFAPVVFDNLSGDNRRHVVSNSLNDNAKKKYYLEDSDNAHRLIEAYDIVATEEQDLTHVFTPRGEQSSVYDHFAAHDKDLINVEDLDSLIAIVQEKYPVLYVDMAEYLSRPYFRGFNCFVMKRDLFFEMCEMEFDVLAELERRIDVTNYDATRARVFGFMAEILYSSFVYHKRKRGQARVCDVQMLYFKNTDPKKDIEPMRDACPLVIDATDILPQLLDVTLQSLLSVAEGRRYDVIVLHTEPMSPFYKKHYQSKFSDSDNIRLTFVPWHDFRGEFLDIRFEAPVRSALPFLPWMLPKYDKVVLCRWNVLFHADPSELLGFDLTGKCLAAVKDVEVVGLVNNMFPDKREYIEELLKLSDPFEFFETSVAVLSLETMRVAYSLEDVLDTEIEYDEPLCDNDIMNVLFETLIAELPQVFNVKLSTDKDFAEATKDLPYKLSDEYSKAKKDAKIITYDDQDPWWLVGADHELEFWGYARKSDFYESIIETIVSNRIDARKIGRTRASGAQRMFNRLLPQGTARRDSFRKAFPYGSPQYKNTRNIVRKIVRR